MTNMLYEQVNGVRRLLLGKLQPRVGIRRTLLENQAQAILELGKYAERYASDGSIADLGPYKHYITIGSRNGYDPCDLFWTDWYLETYPDVATAGMNPLLHYISFGALEGRDPSPLFDTRWYVQNNPEGSFDNPLLHYMEFGRIAGRSPTEDQAIQAIRLSDVVPSTSPVQLVLAAAAKAENSNGTAITRARLRSGKSYLTERNVPFNDISKGAIGAEVVGDYGPASTISSIPYYTILQRALVLPGSGTIFLDDNIVVNDEIESGQCGTNATPLKLKYKNWLKDGDLFVKYKIDITPTIDSGIHIFKEYEENYFHFIAELATKIHLIEHDNLFPLEIPLLVSADMDKNIYDVVNCVKMRERQVIKLKPDVPYRVNKLGYVSDISRILDMYGIVPDKTSSLLPGALLRSLADRVKGELGATICKPWRKLYLVRNSERRSLKNQAEIMPDLLRDGFEPVSTENLTFANQVHLFSQAAVVMGPTGAAMTNLLWCNPGAKAVIFYSDHPFRNKTFWDAIAAAKKLELLYLEGPCAGDVTGIYSIHDNFSIKRERIQEVLRQLRE